MAFIGRASGIVTIAVLTQLPVTECVDNDLCGWCRPGFDCTVIVLTLAEKASPEQLEALNASIGATTKAHDSVFFAVRIPEWMNMCDAMHFYDGHPDVVGSALPDTLMGER